MAEIKGMWLQEPDPSAPDVVVTGAYECPTCGTRLGNVRSTWPQSSLRTTCCGVDVEILPLPELTDGTDNG